MTVSKNAVLKMRFHTLAPKSAGYREQKNTSKYTFCKVPQVY